MGSKQEAQVTLGCGFTFVILLFAFMLITGNVTGSQGDRYGTIHKTSRCGVIWETNELALKPTDEGGTYVFECSCPDDRLFDKVKAFAASGKRVRLTYRKTIGSLPWRSETNFLVTGIEEAPK